MNDSRTAPEGGERLAKVMARAGLCSRRDAEDWIRAGRVVVNGIKVKTPAFNVTEADEVVVDGTPLAAREGTRVWLYHKPRGLVVTEKDPEGRPTVFETLAGQGLPRVVSVGRLDINTEGLLLLTNDGGLKRVLELPATGWLRKYRVRAHGTVTQAQLDGLKAGVTVDGVKYGPIDATLERDQGANVWIEVSLREGKNREVKNVLMALGLEVNRLIRISYGPFQLGDLPVGGIETVKARVLKDQLGKRLADEAGADFTAEGPEPREAVIAREAVTERQFGRGTHTVAIGQQRFRFTDHAERTPAEMEELRRQRPRPDRPGASGPKAPRKAPRVEDPGPERHIHFDDGREPTVFEEKTYGKKPKPGERPAGPRRDTGDRPARPARAGDSKPGARGPRPFGDKPRGPRPAAGAPRPARSFGDKPRAPRAEGDTARPARAFSERPHSDKPRAPKPFGAKPFAGKPRAAATDEAGAPRKFAGKPFGGKPRAGGKSAGPDAPREFTGKPRPAGAKPFRPRPAADGKPSGPRSPSDRPGPPGGKPRAARPAGAARPPRPGGPGRPAGRDGGPPRRPTRPRP